MTAIQNRILDYINYKHWDFKLSGIEEINVKFCPFCKDDNFHLYINSRTGYFYCHKCQQKGSFYTLQSSLGDVAQVIGFKDFSEVKDTVLDFDIEKSRKLLFQNKEAYIYLLNRCLSPEAIDFFKLGLYALDNELWISIPYFLNGKLVNVKLRCLTEKKFKRLLNGRSVWFNADCLQQYNEVIITEGEFDTMALWSIGIKNVISVPDGANSSLSSDNVKLVENIEKIYVCFDNDEAGQRGALKLSERLGKERCYILKLDTKDANDFVKEKGKIAKSEFEQLQLNTKPLGIEAVKSLSEVIQSYLNGFHNEKVILPFPWEVLNMLSGGIHPGDLVVLVARPGVGKTTFAINCLYDLSKHGIPTLLFELEMLPERILPRICSLHLEKNTSSLQQQDFLRMYEELKDFPFYIAYSYKKANWKFVEETIRACVRIYDIKLMVFDNIHFLVRSFEQTKEISVIINNLKLLAEELKIGIIAIARPRKTTVKIIDNVDIKDSADIEGDADLVLILHRAHSNADSLDLDVNCVREGIFEPKMLVRISKCRWNKGGDCYLLVNDAICKILPYQNGF